MWPRAFVRFTRRTLQTLVYSYHSQGGPNSTNKVQNNKLSCGPGWMGVGGEGVLTMMLLSCMLSCVSGWDGCG